jgi:hypothetical protein
MYFAFNRTAFAYFFLIFSYFFPVLCLSQIAPTYGNISYGPYNRNVLDIYKANTSEPGPLVIYIHGGAFRSGDKSQCQTGRNTTIFGSLLANGISVAAINYRFTPTYGNPNDPQRTRLDSVMLDIARAVQFIRWKSEDWGLDKNNIGAYGTSAGGGASIWLAYHDDLADPDSPDPVLRESSRLKAVGHIESQATYDWVKWEDVFDIPDFINVIPDIFDDYYAYRFVDRSLYNEPDMLALRASLDMPSFIGPGDPPTYMENLIGAYVTVNSRNTALHHPQHMVYIRDILETYELPYAFDDIYVPPSQEPDVVEFFKYYLQPQSTCDYIFRLTDASGNGWNGAQLKVMQDNMIVKHINFPQDNPDSMDITVPLQEGSILTLKWSSLGDIFNKVGLEVIDPFGVTIYSKLPYSGVTGAAGQVFFSATTCTPFEFCDGIDNNGDDIIDEGYDHDNDGVTSCAGDCNDNYAGIGLPPDWYLDEDGDGYGTGTNYNSCFAPGENYVRALGDCDDFNAGINPGQIEWCNGLDDDCDTAIDEELIFVNYYTDFDGDVFGAGDAMTLCLHPGDGFTTTEGDCNDFSDEIYPGQQESCNGLDDDCDAIIDEDLVFTNYYTDLDGDGYGSGDHYVECYDPGSGYATVDGDCEDSVAEINPGRAELCNGLDDDCDLGIDEVFEFVTYYADADGDGYGTGEGNSLCLDPGIGNALSGGDCDDTAYEIYPGQTEYCNDLDDDCNLLIDDNIIPITYYSDADGDGYGTGDGNTTCLNPGSGYAELGGDCDDAAPQINPGQVELCNEVDDDCDGLTDTADPDLPLITTWYQDLDGDGRGNPAVSQYSCIPLPGYVADNTDCDDNNPVFCATPLNTITSNITDVAATFSWSFSTCVQKYRIDWKLKSDPNYNNPPVVVYGDSTYTLTGLTPGVKYQWRIKAQCDSLNNGGSSYSPAQNFTTKYKVYPDIDSDSFGDINGTPLYVTLIPLAGYTSNNLDCNDTNADINPGQSELCNDIDDDCDLNIDEDLAFFTYYTDADGDGYGIGSGITLCLNPGIGYAANRGDCEDAIADINPGEAELCNDIDDDCDLSIDEDLEYITYYADADGDGYGTGTGATLCLNPGTGYAALDGDCDEVAADINPGEAELCNDIDDDCDLSIDEDLEYVTYYADADGDGYGIGTGSSLCLNPGTGYAVLDGDCEDMISAINLGQVELCNDIDDDCDLSIDEDLEYVTYYADADGDGYGIGTGSTLCQNPGAGYAALDGDCDEVAADINPGEAELCNDIDDDCDLSIDEDLEYVTYYADADGDGYGIGTGSTLCLNPGTGYAVLDGDCEDMISAINPGQVELCNEVDDDCDGLTDAADPDLPVITTWYQDLDGDGRGNPAVSQYSCIPLPGYVANNTDCDDNNPAFCATPVNTITSGITDVSATFSWSFSTCVQKYRIDWKLKTDPNYNNQPIVIYGDSTYTLTGLTPGVKYQWRIKAQCDSLNNGGSSYSPAQNFTTKYKVFPDIDSDSYGDINSPPLYVTSIPLAGYTSNNLDCNDTNAVIHPGQSELCNDTDDDCDLSIDEDLEFVTYYADGDGDGYGTGTGATLCLNPGTGYAILDGDCDDAISDINPGEAELCNEVDDDCDLSIDEDLAFVTYYADGDGDGYGTGTGATLCLNPGTGYAMLDGDCDDAIAEINPGEAELCNDTDDDCDLSIDEDLGFVTYYADADGDGYGTGTGATLCLNPGTGYAILDGDCEDMIVEINPGEAELCNDIDDDCDQSIDEDLPFVTYYSDGDGDGYGTGTGVTLCLNPGAGYAVLDGDCEDTIVDINPGQSEFCNDIDDDCDLSIDEDLDFVTYYADGDGDGYGTGTGATLCLNPGTGYAILDGDCEDMIVEINPGEAELCNDIDDDCDQSIDEDLPFVTYYSDGDGDGYGTGTGVTLCLNPATGYAVLDGDCDDAISDINPGEVELCNEVDDDCDLSIDEDLDFGTYYSDGDGDGYGTGTGVTLCLNPGTGYAVLDGDCDDAIAEINPGQSELCNDIDDDCDLSIDENLDFVTYYSDGDGDGYGTGTGVTLCLNPGVGFATLDGDCDDAIADINPGEVELCNEVDDDCDLSIDEDLDFGTYYSDGDGDGYGTGTGVTLCLNPGTGYAVLDGDCDDAIAEINPGQSELCNDIDDDCDLSIDENLDFVTYYSDGDGDGYGTGTGVTLCLNPGAGYAVLDGDCDDAIADINPGQSELCNDIDDDCDLSIDEDLDFGTYYSDGDGDGYGTGTGATLCQNPGTGFATLDGDCDDAIADINPGEVELCNDIDDDCDLSIDEDIEFVTYYADGDGDGYGTGTGVTLCLNPGEGYAVLDGDCDDAIADINPGELELCNDIDDDCDLSIDEGLEYATYYADADGDGKGNPAVSINACEVPTGYVTDNTDCDDNNPVACPTPSNPVSNNILDVSATVSWTGTPCAQKYRLDWKLKTSPNYTNPPIILYGVTSYTLTGLLPGTKYQWRVKAQCDSSNSVGSAYIPSQNFTTKYKVYPDTDADSYGDALSLPVYLNVIPSTGYSLNSLDCNDTDAGINPGHAELCNELDDDCDLLVDEGICEEVLQVFPALLPDVIAVNAAASFVDQVKDPGIYLFDLFPNPADDFVIIQQQAGRTGQFDITIYNALGKSISFVEADLSAENRSLTINTGTWNSGLYYFIFREKGKIVDQKSLLIR